MISSKLVRLSSTLAPGIVSNCPSMWDDQNGVIQVTWAAPQRPNGVLLQYYIQLTRYDDGRTVIASASTNEDATLSVELSAANLRKCCRVLLLVVVILKILFPASSFPSLAFG